MMFSLFDDSVIKFVKAHSVAVLATVDESGQPYTSTIYYATFGDEEVRFITKSGTAKYENLLENGKAAMTITDSKKPVAVNLSGTVAKLDESTDHDTTMQTIFKVAQEKHNDYPPIVKLHEGGFAAFSFRPNEAKLTDFTKPMGAVKPELHNY